MEFNFNNLLQDWEESMLSIDKQCQPGGKYGLYQKNGIDKKTNKPHKPFREGICFYPETRTLQYMLSEMNMIFQTEKKYLKELHAVSSMLGGKTSLDSLITSYPLRKLLKILLAIEFKKIHTHYNDNDVRNSLDEFWYRKLTNPSAHNYIGNYNESRYDARDPLSKTSLLSQSTSSDILKLSTLNSNYEKIQVTEIHCPEETIVEEELDMFRTHVEKRYDVEFFEKRITGLIHPRLNNCHLIITKLNNKR